ncbi:E3 ubiquitin-protein ligase CHFR-like [Thunnus maccoyii]|uniref:E3 ubiquitin-protein ligase CHFR-like n=1 Tax=Thunnus maccoyii TaxID=8240 RepID=UPI001C4AF8BD|nr:E3 ubiquitin-protein ligase CHFR-like [Thunnus maccoyii]
MFHIQLPSTPSEELSHPVQCETDPTAVNRVVVYGDLTYTPPSVEPDPSELLEVVVDGQQTSPTTSVQCETDPTAVNRVVVYGDLTYTPPSVSAHSLYTTDNANAALFPGASSVSSTFDLTPRGHDEFHYEEETSSASNIRGQRSSFMPTPATTSSTTESTASAPPRASVSTFQSGKDEDAAGIGEVTERIEELVLASQSLPDVAAAITELISLAATQRVILTPSQLHTIKQGFCCVVCMDLIVEPVFAQCCRSIIGCKACMERWQQTSVYCPKCRGNTAENNIFEVTGLLEAFSVLRSLFEDL